MGDMCMDIDREELSGLLNPFRDLFLSNKEQLTKIEIKVDKLGDMLEQGRVQSNNLEKEILKLKTAHDFTCANQKESFNEIREKILIQEHKTEGLQTAVNELRQSVPMKKELDESQEKKTRKTMSLFQIIVASTAISSWIAGIIYFLFKIMVKTTFRP
jgi:hypothetical protein